MTDLLPDAVLRYAEHEDGILDVHLPAEPNGTTVLLVHGGFWKTAYDRTHTRSMARAVSAAGFVVASPEYRRVGPGGTGGWPRTAEDVRRALDRLPELLGSLDVPAGPVRAIGHSAGGHLVLWLAATGAPLERVVALAPVCDLREAIRRGLGSDATQAFLGGADPDTADPVVLLDGPARTEVRIVHGTADDVVPVELSRGLADRHRWVDLREVPADHFAVIEPTSSVWPEVMLALGPALAD